MLLSLRVDMGDVEKSRHWSGTYSGLRCALVDPISRRPVIFIFQRLDAATIDATDEAVVAVNFEASTATG